MSTATPPAPRRSRAIVLIPIALLALMAVCAYMFWPRKAIPPKPPADLAGAITANSRGVGYMDRHDFKAAEKEFAEAVRLAPDWLPAKVNLGISMFNQQPADNKTLTEHVELAKDIFRDVLKAEPNNPYAHYCLGILDLYVTKVPEAYAHFIEVNKYDLNDAHTWLRVGATHPDGVSSPAAIECFQKALKLNPYLNEARYRLAMGLRETNPELQIKLLKEFEELKKADRYVESGIKYGEMGKYASVIGRDDTATGKPVVGPVPVFETIEQMKVTLATDTKWATTADLDATRKAARERFGATIVLWDFNNDGQLDIFVASAVIEGGKVRDLLLRNDGNNQFTDVTAACGLLASHATLSAAAADYDNDGNADIVLAGVGGATLFRNKGDGTFENASGAAKLDNLKGTYLGCSWIDIDQDSDLDFVLCQYSDNNVASFDAAKPVGAVLLFENRGVAPPAPATGPPPGLSTVFSRNDVLKPFQSATASVSILATDHDRDGDIELLLLPHGEQPVLIDNDRLMRFTKLSPAWTTNLSHPWLGGLVLDANHDERSDLLLLRVGVSPLYFVSTKDKDYTPGTANSPALRQAIASDIDADSWTDVVGLTVDGKVVLLHNQGDARLETKNDAFGLLTGVHAIAVADFTADGSPDLLTLTDTGLQLHRNVGNGNNTLLIEPTGLRNGGNSERTNKDGIGAWIAAHASTHWAGAERTTMTAGLGQSQLPTALGIGKDASADVVRIVWPDAVNQAELATPANRVSRITEINRKSTSCPVLMTWDGEKFVFVTDFLGGGALGESGPDGSIRPPRPEESVKIESRLLALKDGHYVMKIAEPMDEVLYLDHLRLAVIDHPAETHIFPDERFVFSGPEASQKLLAFRKRYFPKSATDHKNRDVTKLILERDRRAVDSFAVRSWLGYAEDHSLTLDFDELPQGGKWYLVLAGWTEYPYPESMYAATRAGVTIQPPVLEKLDPATGKWITVCDLGFPAGLPRVMTRELPTATPGKYRISTNMQVYWDQIYLAQAEEPATIGSVKLLDVSHASLAYRGFMQEVYPDGRLPVAYDDAKTEPVAVTKWKGKLTRFGDVTELLQASDDRFVLCGPGDEITVRFDAKSLPPLRDGWQRSFVLQTRGYCKDTSTTTVSGGTVGPLPFRAMPNYPHFGTTKPPATDADKWHTRPAH